MSVKSLLRRLWTRLLRTFRWHAGSVPHDDLAHGNGWVDCFAARAARPAHSFRPRLEDLEGRLAPATFKLVAGVTDNQPGSLRAAILAADTNSSASNTIKLGDGTFSLTDTTDGNLLIDDQNSAVVSKTLTIVGQGETKTIVTGGSNWADRIFEVVGRTGALMTVVFKDFTIEGGRASNGGVVGGSDALGGGLLIDGANVTLSKVNLQGNIAVGHNGNTGGLGNNAFGGGIYVASGTLTLSGGTINNNQALGGNGGSGSAGANGAAGNPGRQGLSGHQGASGFGGNNETGLANAGNGGTGKPGGLGLNGSSGGPGGNGGQGGPGGNGGGGFGGGIFVASGQVTLSSTAIAANLAAGGTGGPGGPGGRGGQGGTGGKGGPGGQGGPGGKGGSGAQTAFGTGAGGNGGNGGRGGLGGTGGNGGNGGAGGNGGRGGDGGTAFGGGIAVASGTGKLILTTCTVADNFAVGGPGGAGRDGGGGGSGGKAGEPGLGGQGGRAGNGGAGKPGGKDGAAGHSGLPGVTGRIGFSGQNGVGGTGGNGGNAAGAGIWVAEGTGPTVSLTGTTVAGSATAGAGGLAPAGNGAAGAAGTASPAPILGAFSPGKQLLTQFLSAGPPGFARPLAFVTANVRFTLVVQVVDSSGNVITSFNGPVTISLAANPGKDHLSGTLMVNAVSGVATFSPLELHNVAFRYRLKVSAGGAVSTLTKEFDVVPNVQLLVTAPPPASVRANVPFTVAVELVDSPGGVITSFNGPVTISLAANPGKDHLSGTLTVKAVKGVATFRLELHHIAKGYRLKVSAGTVSAFTEPFDVTGNL
jgi:hypothetical protein